MSNLQLTKRAFTTLPGNTEDMELCNYFAYTGAQDSSHWPDSDATTGIRAKVHGSCSCYKSGLSFPNGLPETSGKVEDLGLELGIRMSNTPRV